MTRVGSWKEHLDSVMGIHVRDEDGFSTAGAHDFFLVIDVSVESQPQEGRGRHTVVAVSRPGDTYSSGVKRARASGRRASASVGRSTRSGRR